MHLDMKTILQHITHSIKVVENTYIVEGQYNEALQKAHHSAAPMSNPQLLVLFAELNHNLLLIHTVFQQG